MGRRSLLTPEIEQLLGKVLDVDIAQAAHVSVSAVIAWRKKANIAAFKSPFTPPEPALDADGNVIAPEPRVPGKRGRGPSKLMTPEVIAKLGTIPDSALAKELGVSVPTIFTWRKKNGIMSFQEANPAQKVEKAEGTATDTGPKIKTVTLRIKLPEGDAVAVREWALEQKWECKG